QDGTRTLYVTGVQTCALPIYGCDAVRAIPLQSPVALCGLPCGQTPHALLVRPGVEELGRGGEDRLEGDHAVLAQPVGIELGAAQVPLHVGDQIACADQVLGRRRADDGVRERLRAG